jgi:hypothetical protein
MKANNKGWDQCGNAQAAVDSKDQIIVACDVIATLRRWTKQARQEIAHLNSSFSS